MPEKLQWTPAAELTFQQLNEALTSAPILRIPDFDWSFQVQTDASETGLGADLWRGRASCTLHQRKLNPAGLGVV